MGILAGGNKLKSWSSREADLTLKVCLILKLESSKDNMHIFFFKKNVCLCPVFD